MSSSIKLIGKTTDFVGKSLWEIVSNLKNFGAGRVISKLINKNLIYKVLKILDKKKIFFCSKKSYE
jgi:hypothetical protein